MREPDEQRFLNEVANHEMTVLIDNGTHRHIRFRRPGTSCMGFDLVTWPGYLAVSGDMGDFMFTRLPDMFEFFRDPQFNVGQPLHINPQYWAQKCRAGKTEEYSADRFKEAISYRLDEMEASPELRQEVEENVLPAGHDGEYAAHLAARDFEHDGRQVFPDFWEWRLREHTYHFIWICYAIAWGIRHYDSAKVPA